MKVLNCAEVRFREIGSISTSIEPGGKMPTVKDVVSRQVLIPSILLSILLIILGFLAITLPTATSIGVALLIGWLVLFGGLVQCVHAFQSKGIGNIIWKLLVAAFYLAAGAYLIAHPALGLASLTLALAIFFFAEGVVDVIAYFSTRKSGGSAWMLLDGIVTLLLGLMIWKRWPATSLWVIGTLVGISMLMTGITRLMMAVAVRKLLKDRGDRPRQERWAA
jgi:uncharacterized membrane protein HdeD (DUF308 family)